MEAEEFGAKLRELRQQLGLTLRELADKVGIDFTYLSKIENGVLPPPSEKVISKLAEVLGADKDELTILAGRIPSDIAPVLKNRKTLQRLRAQHAREMARASNRRGRMNIFKQFKSFSRIAVATVLVLAVAASLWFAAPAPVVKALDFTFSPTHPSGTVATPLTFTVKIDVQDVNDVLPIGSIDLIIGDAAFSPSYYVDLFPSLPIPAGPNSTSTKSITGTSGTINVTGTTGAYWGYDSSTARYGYGYAYSQSAKAWLGQGTYGLGTSLGYGYGYHSFIGATSITYNITWTPPSNWPAGTYHITAVVNGNSDIQFVESTSFTLSAAVAGGAGFFIEPGVTDVSASIDESGVFTSDVTAESADAKVELTIDEGTTGLTKTGQPLSEISITEMAEPPAPPAEANVLGLTYDFGPDEATFDPPITLTFTYDPAEIPEGVNEEDLVIAYFDEDTGEWVELEGCVVDPVTHTISAPVSHFTAFQVIACTRPAAFATSNLSISPTKVDIGQKVTIGVMVANIGDLADTYEVTLKIDNVTVDTETVTLDGGASKTVTFTTSKDVAGTYAVTVDGLSGTFTVEEAAPPPTPAAFTTSNLSISPTKVDVGKSVTISATIANTGDLAGSYEVTLKVNNVTVDTETVTLDGGASKTVTFTTSKDVAGTYTVSIDGLSGTFTVEEAVVPPPPPTEINWWLIGGIIAGVVIAAVVIFLVVRRRRI